MGTVTALAILKNVEHWAWASWYSLGPAKLKWVPGCRRLLCPLCSLSPGILGCHGKACLHVCMLSVSWRGFMGRHVSGVWLHNIMHGLSFYTRKSSYFWPRKISFELLWHKKILGVYSPVQAPMHAKNLTRSCYTCSLSWMHAYDSNLQGCQFLLAYHNYGRWFS